MEFDLWHCLCSGSGRPSLRLRIPEVCVFRGGELDGWYYTAANGQVARRKPSTREEVLEKFLAAAKSERRIEAGKNAVVAILRKAVLHLPGEPAPYGLLDTVMLTEPDLRDLFARLDNGTSEFRGPWSLQTVVEPVEDVRVICVYTCDAWGVERSDVFARPFGQAYPMDGTVRIPEGNDVALDTCIEMPAYRASVLEAKALSIVHHIARSQHESLEGLIVEFVFDSQRRPVLHGSFGASLLSPEVRKRLVNGTVPSRGVPRKPLLKAFPVPTVKNRCDEASELLEQEAEELDPEPVGADLSQQGVDFAAAASSGCAPAAVAALEAELLTSLPRLERHPLEGRQLLVEVWSLEEFLGEAWLPAVDLDSKVEPSLTLAAVSEESRQDAAKSAVCPDGRSRLLLALQWDRGSMQEPRLLFGPAQALDLHVTSGQFPCTRLLLWMKEADGVFSLLWTSKEVSIAENPLFADVVQLDIPPLKDDWQPHASTSMMEASTLAPPRRRRPQSARGAREEASSQVGRAAWSIQSQLSGPSPTPSRGLSRRMSAPNSALYSKAQRKVVVELQQTVTSPRDQVVGAGLDTHWGMEADDGTMSTHVLASQICQRMGQCGRIVRSTLMTQLAAQLLQYYELELSWREQMWQAEEMVKRAEAEIHNRHEECDRLKDAMMHAAEVAEQKLGHTLQELCGQLDEKRSKEQDLAMELQDSKRRQEEQQALIQQLRDESSSLEVSLAKTIQKFDEVSSEYAEMMKPQPGAGETAPADPAEAAAQRAAQQARAEAAQANNPLWQLPRLRKAVEEEASELVELKAKLVVLQDQLPSARSSAGRLETFVKGMALGPMASVRTGGGFAFDSKVKREARCMLQELYNPGPCYPDNVDLDAGASRVLVA